MSSEPASGWDIRRLAGIGFVAAMVSAPFLALLYGPDWALIVMTLALLSTTYLAWDARRQATAQVRRKLNIMLIVNAAFAVACGVVLAARQL